jgi:hypothetical protein
VLAVGARFAQTWVMQGRSDPNRVLLDAAVLCRVLVPEGGVEAFWLIIAARRGGVVRRSRRMSLRP